MAVAAALGNLPPPIVLHQANDFTNLYRHVGSVIARANSFERSDKLGRQGGIKIVRYAELSSKRAELARTSLGQM